MRHRAPQGPWPHARTAASALAALCSCPALSPGRPAASSGRTGPWGSASGQVTGRGSLFNQLVPQPGSPATHRPFSLVGTASHRACGWSRERSPSCASGPAARPRARVPVPRVGTPRQGDWAQRGRAQGGAAGMARAGGPRCGAGRGQPRHTAAHAGSAAPGARGRAMPPAGPPHAHSGPSSLGPWQGGAPRAASTASRPLQPSPRAPTTTRFLMPRAAPALHTGAEPSPPPRPPAAARAPMAWGCWAVLHGA